MFRSGVPHVSTVSTLCTGQAGTHPMISQHIEDVTQQHERAGCEAVQVLCIRHL